MTMMSQNPVVFFDGVCNLCQASVQFIIRHDRRNTFRFTALQGEYAKTVLPDFNIDQANMNSIILLENDRLYTQSSAALRIAKRLNGLWPLLYIFMLIPKFIRDGIYNIIAKNRYRWWGKQAYCWVPTPELKNKFLD